MINVDDGGGGGGIDFELAEKVQELLDAAADKAVDGDLLNHELLGSHGEAQTRAVEIAGAVHGEITEISGGYRVEQVAGGMGTASDNEWHLVTRDSEIWKNRRSELEEKVRLVFDSILDYHPWELAGAQNSSRAVHAGLMQETFPEGVNEENLLKKHDDQVGSVDGEMPVWSNIGVVDGRLSSYTGDVVDVFSQVYLDRMPYILSGQLMIAGYLSASLDIAETAFEKGLSDTKKIVQATIDGLEASRSSGDFDYSEALGIMSSVLGLAGSIAATIPGGQALGAGLGIAGGAAGLLSNLTADDAKDPVVAFAGMTADEIIDGLAGELKNKVIGTVEKVEQSVAAAMNELREVAGDNSVVSANIDLACGVQLTRHDAWFRPRSPGSVGLDGGVDVAGDDSHTSGELNVDPDVLRDIGTSTLPAMAGGYRGASSSGSTATSGLEGAFTRRSSLVEGSTYAGHLYHAWVPLNELLMRFISQSATNLDQVGKNLTATANALEGTDADNADEIARAEAGR